MSETVPASAGDKKMNGRISSLDILRGVMILYSVFYHLYYDLILFGLAPMEPLFSSGNEAVHFVCYTSFVFASGLSGRLSRSNARRGLLLAGAAGLVSLGTWIVDREYFIRFGVLHLLSFLALLTALGEEIARKVKQKKKTTAETKPKAMPRRVGTLFLARDILFPALLLGCFFSCWFTVYDATFPVEGLAWLGFRNPSYLTSDWFPVIPHIFLYMAGYMQGKSLREGNFPAFVYSLRCPPLEWLGKRTLWIYLAHQPVCYGLVWLFTTFFHA